MTDTRTPPSGEAGAAQTAGTAFDPFAMLGASFTASMDAMSAWSRTCQSILEKRVGPAAGLMMGAAGNPAAWPDSVTPILDEIRQALALPRFADLPSLNGALMPSPADSVELMLLLQQYLAAVTPVWVKACEDFQSEVAARSARGEPLDAVADGLDVWNGVLDRTLMAFNRSGEFGALQQRMLRLTMRQRRETRQRVEMVAEAIDMPTRTEMLDVYGRLHGLMREVHALRREVRTLKAQGSGPPSGRKTAAKAKQGAAGTEA